MKKLFYAAAFAALALTGCSTEEESVAPVPPPADKVPVGFSTSIVEVTRGVPVSGTTFGENEKIGVYGIEKKGEAQTAGWMENVCITNDPTEGWIYDTSRYFMLGYTYNFAAYAPYKATGNPDLSNLAAVEYNVPIAIENQEDFMYAVALEMDFSSTAPTASDKVAFTFKHALSQVKFTLKTEKNYSAYTLKVKQISFADIIKEGKLNMTTGLWDKTTATTDTYTQKWDSKEIASDGSETALSADGEPVLMLIPQNPKAKKMTILLNISTASDTTGKDESIVIDLPDNEWFAANAYNYLVTLHLDSILGVSANIESVAIEKWTDQTISIK